MTEMLEGTGARSDAELISDVRSGNLDAYGELFSRHADAARRLARQFARGSDAEDLVSEAFTKVMGVLADGGGPNIAFRAYLLTTIRRLHVDRVRKDSRLTNCDDMRAFDTGAPFPDNLVAEFDSSAAARAFASLPVRWQVVLWHLEVENQKPVDIAPLLGMTPNSVCALAYRAREGLRQAFLSAHLGDTRDAGCRWTVQHLGAYVRTGLTTRESTKVKAHLDACRSCAAMSLELAEVNSNLRGVIAPLLLGAAATGYLAGAGSSAGSAGIVALLCRVRDSLFGSSGVPAGTTSGVTAGTSAGAVGGTAAAAAGTPAATVAATAGVTSAGATAATTAAAATAAGVTAGGAVAGVAAGTAGVLGAVAAGAASSAAGVGVASLAMIAVGTVATSIGVDPSAQYVDGAVPMSFTSAIIATAPDVSPGVTSLETVPMPVEPAPPPDPAPADGTSSVTPPVTSSDSTAPGGEADQSSGTSASPDPAPVDAPTQESTADQPTVEAPPPPEPDPSTTLSDGTDTADSPPPDSESTPPSDTESTLPVEPSSSPVESTSMSSPDPTAPLADPLPEPGEQLVEPSEGQAP